MCLSFSNYKIYVIVTRQCDIRGHSCCTIFNACDLTS